MGKFTVLKKILLSAALLAIIQLSFAQILSDSSPLVLKKEILASVNSLPLQLPQIDIARLEKEDELNDKFKNKPYRFGENIAVDIDPTSSGNWFTQNGQAVWQLEIQSDGALNLGYFFSEFKLPASAKLFIIDKATGEYFGAITSQNNSELNNLSTWPFAGSTHTLQLVVDPQEKPAVSLKITQITHGYRDFKATKSIDDSDSCNINAICPEAAAWPNQRNSTVMIISGGSGLCSGTLMNNTLNNGRPYILTAEHCGVNNVSNWSFRFNYESSDCDSSVYTGPNQSISGAVLRAHNTESDFSLLEMTLKPPTEYGAYYAGWDRSDSIPSSQFTFHHPSADLKKYSQNDNNGIRTTYFDEVGGNKCWKIDEWEKGTTEGGSSGSGLYDQNGKIIGQLLGGLASCSALSESDFFGRLAISFEEHNNDSSRSLNYWLDPGFSGTTVTEGRDPDAPLLTLDAALAGLSGVPSSVCASSINPVATIYNSGTQTLTTLTLTMTIDGSNIATEVWTGSLVSGQSAQVPFGVISLSNGTHDLKIVATQANNGVDQQLTNNQSNRTITINSLGLLHEVEVKLDDFGSENEWRILDANNVVVASEGPFSDNLAGTTVSTLVCLQPGCYTFEFTDRYGDGMCCSFGDGSYRFIESRYDTLVEGWNTPPGPADVSITEISDFCIEPDGIKEFANINYRTYPNPTNGNLTLVFSDDKHYSATLSDLAGKMILSKTVSNSDNTLQLDHLNAGFYLLQVSINGNVQTSKVQLIK